MRKSWVFERAKSLLDGLMPWRAAALREPVAYYQHPNAHYFEPAKNLTPSFTCSVRSCLGATILSRVPGCSQLDEDIGQNAINRDWIPMLQSADKLWISSRSSKGFQYTHPCYNHVQNACNDRELEFIWRAPSGLTPPKAEAPPQHLRCWCLGLLGYSNINQLIGQISKFFDEVMNVLNSNSVLQRWGIMLSCRGADTGEISLQRILSTTCFQTLIRD